MDPRGARQHSRSDGGKPDRGCRPDIWRLLSAGAGDGHHVPDDGPCPHLPALGALRGAGMTMKMKIFNLIRNNKWIRLKFLALYF